MKIMIKLGHCVATFPSATWERVRVWKRVRSIGGAGLRACP
jgi:hypothetical protein